MNEKDDFKVEFRSDRWYADTTDGLDGTAQGYGYKTEQSLRKARWFFLNKSKIVEGQNSAKEWLRANPEAKAQLNAFTGNEDIWLQDLKNGGSGLTFGQSLDEHRVDHGAAPWFQALENDAPLAKSVWKFVMDGPNKKR